uniref:SUEL-type lectin domain-containing protein n=1 Tax=Neogobius melanostomus TaxID=47308 RepID=A0A8C6SHW2_9GOBI
AHVFRQCALRTVCTITTAYCPKMFDLNAVSLSGLGQVLHIDSADYGRSDRTTCSQGRPSEQLQNVNCASSTATDLVAEINSVFGDPCFGTYKYLQVSYCCKPIPIVRTGACEGHTADLSCDSGKVIRIHRADYGRSDRTICSQGRPSQQVQNVNCAASTAPKCMTCNGKSLCSVSASNSVFGDPCGGTYKYLLVSYSCEPIPFGE